MTATADILAGQTYRTRERSIHWRILAVDDTSARAVRVRKADGQTWLWDRDDDGRTFRLDIIREHWTLIA